MGAAVGSGWGSDYGQPSQERVFAAREGPCHPNPQQAPRSALDGGRDEAQHHTLHQPHVLASGRVVLAAEEGQVLAEQQRDGLAAKFLRVIVDGRDACVATTKEAYLVAQHKQRAEQAADAAHQDKERDLPNVPEVSKILVCVWGEQSN